MHFLKISNIPTEVRMLVQLKEVNQTRILGNDSVPIVGGYRQPFILVFKSIIHHPNMFVLHILGRTM